MANILIGVTGGIAAYKVADITGALLKHNHTVKIIMTENSKKFITPLTLSTLSKNPAFDDASEWSSDGVIKHIELSKWANIFAIVPATANTIIKIAEGVADNLLTSAYLAFNKKTVICPAMNTNMWDKPHLQHSLNILRERYNHHVLNPEVGLLACGDTGMGKLPSTKKIVEFITDCCDSCYTFDGGENAK
jgi:phosphopantothenoylcysteine decarboxylase/phosphopantothenate--cysteine ligase